MTSLPPSNSDRWERYMSGASSSFTFLMSAFSDSFWAEGGSHCRTPRSSPFHCSSMPTAMSSWQRRQQQAKPRAGSASAHASIAERGTSVIVYISPLEGPHQRPVWSTRQTLRTTGYPLFGLGMGYSATSKTKFLKQQHRSPAYHSRVSRGIAVQSEGHLSRCVFR